MPKEYELLALFMQNKHIALTREILLEKVWGYDFAGETRTVDAHVQRLRKKLNWKDEITTVFKTGYRLG
jgi:two-component system alkaline phosphatase synthesis response regulator PhoP